MNEQWLADQQPAQKKYGADPMPRPQWHSFCCSSQACGQFGMRPSECALIVSTQHAEG